MRYAATYLLPFVCLLMIQAGQAQDPTILPTDDPSTVSLSSETANNTSACFAALNPSYCTKQLPNLTTSATNQQPQYMVDTITVDAIPEHISTISLKRLMYQNWTGQLLCEYQPWFDDALNGHIDVGYNENSLPTVTLQDTKMISRGCNINLIDFYGQTDSTYDFNRQVTDKVYSDLAGRNTYPLKFGILEDVGAFYNECKGKSEADTITCIEGALESDIFYIHTNYANPNLNSGLYWKDNGTNVIGFFGACGTFTSLSCTTPNDWDTIWNAVQSYVNTNSYNFKFVFQFGNFAVPAISAGEYAWPQPYTDGTDTDSFVDNPPSQYWWCDGAGKTCDGSNTSGAYLDNFYYQGSPNPGKLTIGLLYSGFDDSNAGWGRGRVIAQRCGQVLLDTANEVTKGLYWGGTGTLHQIPYMMMATWNDYEEGSEQESGVDNCYTAVSLAYQSGSTTKINLTLTNNDLYGYANTKTIHHYVVWTATSGQTTLTQRKQLTSSSTQFDMTPLHLPIGNYDVYLEMVGQPSTQNEMSASLAYQQH